MRRQRFLSLLSVLIFFSGCGKEETPSERRVRELISQAVSAMQDENDSAAREFLHEAIALINQPDYVKKSGEPFLLLGESYSRTADFDSAFMMFARARELYAAAADREGVRASVLARAEAHRLRGEEDRAIDILQEQVRRDEALGERSGQVHLLWAILPLARELGVTDLEPRVLTQLATVAEERSDRSMAARVHRERGLGSLQRGELDDALQHFANGLTLAREAGDSLLIIDFYLQRAKAYARAEKINQSFVEFTEGLSRTDRTTGSEALREEMMMRVGNIYLRQRQPENARIFFTRTVASANATGKPLLEGYALLQLGHCARSTEEALRSYQLAAELLDSSGVPWAQAYAMACLSVAALRSNRAGEALQFLQKGAEAAYMSTSTQPRDNLFADCEQTFYSTGGVPAPDALIELLLQLQRTDEAFMHEETYRRAQLQHAYHEMHLRPDSESLRDAVQNFADARSTLHGTVGRLVEACTKGGRGGIRATQIRVKLEQARRRMRDIGDSLAQLFPRMSVLFSIQPPSIGSVQRHLPPGTAFADYIASTRSATIVLLTRTSVQTLLSPVGKRELLNMMEEYVRLLSTAADHREGHGINEARMRELSARLYGVLLRPVERILQNLQRLYIAFPLDAQLVPVHTLRAEGVRTTYAIERFAFRYCSDAECLTFERANLPVNPTVIGVGNPGASAIDVEYEVRDARVFYRGAKLYFGEDANITTLQKERADLLHAALDLHYQPTAPHRSHVVLKAGPGYTDEREVPLGEFLAVKPYNTILLSNLRSDGAHPAVQRLLLMSGASSLISNGYPLPRKTKKRFNELFYAELLQNTAVEAAYRNALLYMLKDKQHNAPYFWGAYFLW